MVTTAYIFFTKLDPSTMTAEQSERFNTAAERAVAVSLRYSAVRIVTGTCKSSGASEVYIHICESEPPSGSRVLQTVRLRERLVPEINRLYSALGIKSVCDAKSITVKLTDEAPSLSASAAASGSSEDTIMSAEYDYSRRATIYKAEKPLYRFDRVILPDETRKQLDEAVATVQYGSTVFDTWGLRDIISPTVALNFYGDPGTGKTMAAEAIADRLDRRIIRASCADIESKYHGEGPKMVKALFLAAEQQNAVLFIDEADSLLSRRIEQVTQGSEQAINSMRSQLLMSLDKFTGVVIFATNLIENYDPAFISRLRCIKFPVPVAEARREIWRVHLYATKSSPNLNIPLADDVDFVALAEKYEMCGRDIREAVKSACVRTAMNRAPKVTQQTLIGCCEDILSRKNELI